MKNTTEHNLEARIHWLLKIIMHEISLSPSEVSILSDLRTFLSSEIKGLFTRKAYNTIKTYAVENRSIATPHHHPNTWEYLKELRTQAYQETMAQERLAEGEKNIKNLENTALLEAHLCGMAYFEVYEFLRSLLKEPSLTNLIEAKIKNFLSISQAKYEHITSHHSREAGTLHVIRGGKE